MATSPVTYSSPYVAPFYGGAGVADASVVPGKFSVAINGRPFMLNTDPQAIESYGDFFMEVSLPLMRQQADQGKTPGEQSIDPRQFWRRSQDTWHKGAGQSVLDRDDSDPARYSASKGLDPWTRYELSLLNGTALLSASANTNLAVVAAADRAYWLDGNNVKTSANLSTVATVTGTPAAAARSLATNGGVVWVTFGASGVYQILSGATVAASYNTGTADLVGYVKGRLLVTNGASLYNPVVGGGAALPAAFYTHPDSAFTWRAFAEGNGCIYVAGDSGDRSWIYRVTVQPDGSALTVPVVAGTLPTGEVVRSMLGYLGYLVVGTDKGVRFATATDSGDLTLGALIPTPATVQALDAQDRFVWFGWTNYDASSTGLGRLDLTAINDALAPAYASDLMATTQGAVLGVATVSDRKVFSVSGHGIYAEAVTSLSTGTLTTGQITYGIADPKVAVFVDLKHAPLPSGATVGVTGSFDRATGIVLGTSATPLSVSPPRSISAKKKRSEETELTFTLSVGLGVSGPTLTRWTLLSYPAPTGTSMITLPLMLASTVLTFTDAEYSMDTSREYLFLVDLHNSRSIATIQVGNDNFEGTLEDFKWIPYDLTRNRDFWNGTFVAAFRRITS